MLDPDEAFPIRTISRRNIVDEINNYLDADHQLEPGDDRLTRDICRGWAASIDSRDFPNEDEDQEANVHLAVNTAVEIGIGDHIEDEWKDFIEVWYEITGVDRNGKRFRKTTTNEAYARGHNVWRGTLWKCTQAGRKRIHTWSN